MLERQYVIDAITVNDTWRLFKIMAEIVDGFETLSEFHPCVSIFGSARVAPGDEMYEKTVVIARQLAESGFHIITGGGPGIMEAGNKGAKEGGTTSIGLNIQLPLEQGSNPYADVKVDFKYFFVRKLMFLKYSQAYIGMPGGFGTLDELFEAITLIQTKRIKPFPVVLVGSDHWNPLWDWVRSSLLEGKLISPEDVELVTILDDPEEIVKTITRIVIV